jgi:23S rRNA (cytosine1962-C5)-methyltransferase
MLARVILKARRARPFFARHPWVYLPSIDRVDGEPEAGAEVSVCTHDGTFIARGLFNPNSLIRVRLYRWEDAPLDRDFWAQRIAAAVNLRRSVLRLSAPGQGCRLVASEADGLSGLTVDQYDRWLVVQVTSLALHTRQNELLDLLQEQTGTAGMVPRLERGIAAQEGLPGLLPEGALRGSVPDEPVVIEEHGLSYEVDLRVGQKTGFYLDQRENRRAVAGFASGRRILDLYCYTGGFGLTALRLGGAAHSLGIDTSAPAIEQARRNAVRNGLGNARFEQSDVPEALEKLRSAGETFGLIVCDPPKFARTERDLDRALQAYARLNRSALDVLEPGGILATCSCSGHVTRDMLQQVLASVAESAGRPIQLLDQRGAAPDHPVAASCLETEYLKCFIARVE